MLWVIGTIVVVLALVAISKRRNRRDPTYDETSTTSSEAATHARPFRRRSDLTRPHRASRPDLGAQPETLRYREQPTR